MEPTPPPSPAPATGPRPEPVPVDRRPLLLGGVVLVIGLIAVVGAAVFLPGLGGSSASPGPSAAPSSVAANASPSVSPTSTPIASTAPSPLAPRPRPTSAIVTDQPIGSTGSIAVLGLDGSLSVVEAGGRSTPIADAVEATFGFPAWSPDGSRLAAIQTTATEASIVVFDAKGAVAGLPVEPLVIFRSDSIGPFYLYWSPDGKAVTFLANEADDLSLRIAPADGSAPLDGSGPGALVRTGSPLYYDWIERDRLLAHIGLGSDAFLGEVGLDGKAGGKPLGAPGDFRSAVVSHDGASIAFVRANASGPSDVVVEGRDGSDEHLMPVFGTAAVVFDPSGDTVASIGPSEAGGRAFSVPVGPVRLVDAGSGKVRMLLEGLVASLWWSPDGKTIAALRLAPVPASASPAIWPSAQVPSPAEVETEIHLVFVHVATGKIRSQSVVTPGSTYINQFLAYFDQYALSHRVWAPDSSSFLVPERGPDGTTHITVLFPGGEPSIELDGEMAFWSP